LIGVVVNEAQLPVLRIPVSEHDSYADLVVSILLFERHACCQRRGSKRRARGLCAGGASVDGAGRAKIAAG
jgi:hypothetical protein